MGTTTSTSFNLLADRHSHSDMTAMHPVSNAIIYDTDDEALKAYKDGEWVDIIGTGVSELKGTAITVSSGNDIDLGDSQYDSAVMIVLSWSGGNGSMDLNLPLASENENRLIRLISNSTFHSSTHAELSPVVGDDLDGNTNSYRINKAYEGILVWSDGNEWFILQKKA